MCVDLCAVFACGSAAGHAQDWDSCELLKVYSGPALNILVDQGTEDQFLKNGQLLTPNLEVRRLFVCRLLVM